MAAQYELLKELLNSGATLSFGQDIFFKFYQVSYNFLRRTVCSKTSSMKY